VHVEVILLSTGNLIGKFVIDSRVHKKTHTHSRIQIFLHVSNPKMENLSSSYVRKAETIKESNIRPLVS